MQVRVLPQLILNNIKNKNVVLTGSYFVGRTIVEDCDSLFGTIFLQTTVGLIVLKNDKERLNKFN